MIDYNFGLHVRPCNPGLIDSVKLIWGVGGENWNNDNEGKRTLLKRRGLYSPDYFLKLPTESKKDIWPNMKRRGNNPPSLFHLLTPLLGSQTNTQAVNNTVYGPSFVISNTLHHNEEWHPDHDMESWKGAIFFSWVQRVGRCRILIITHNTWSIQQGFDVQGLIWYAVEKKETPVGARSIQDTHGIHVFLLIIYVIKSTDITKIFQHADNDEGGSCNSFHLSFQYITYPAYTLSTLMQIAYWINKWQRISVRRRVIPSW